MPDDEPKIIIDEDWKSQVQREKEAAQVAATAGGEEAEAEADADAAPGQQAPPEAATFGGLVDSLAAQALFALGVIAPQGTEQITLDLAMAKFTIDMLTVLREKTKNNLTPEEEGALTENIAELQRIYVARTYQVQEAELRRAGVDLSNIKGPEQTQ